MAHQLLLNLQRKPEFGQSRPVRVPEGVPSQLRQTDCCSHPVQVTLPHRIRVVGFARVEVSEQAAFHRQFGLSSPAKDIDQFRMQGQLIFAGLRLRVLHMTVDYRTPYLK